MKLSDLPYIDGEAFYKQVREFFLASVHVGKVPSSRIYFTETGAVDFKSQQGTVLLQLSFQPPGLGDSPQVFEVKGELTLKDKTGRLHVRHQQSTVFYGDELAEAMETCLSAGVELTREEFELGLAGDDVVAWLRSFSFARLDRLKVRALRPEQALGDLRLLPRELPEETSTVPCPWPFKELDEIKPPHPTELPNTPYGTKLAAEYKKLSSSGWDKHLEDSFARTVMRCKAQGFALITQSLDEWGGPEADIIEKYKLTFQQIRWIMEGRIDKFTLEQITELIIRAGYDYDFVFRHR